MIYWFKRLFKKKPRHDFEMEFSYGLDWEFHCKHCSMMVLSISTATHLQGMKCT